MTTDNVTVSRELLELVLCRIDTGSPEWDIGVLIDTLRAALEQPLVEPEMHEAMCPALTGCKCNCPTSPAFVDKAWAQFCGGVGRGPGAPYPGMIEAFEAHYGQSFTDRDWRNESSIWAAAWKAAKAHQPPQPQQPAPVQEQQPVAWVEGRWYEDGTRAGNTLVWASRAAEDDFPVGTNLYTAQPRKAVKLSDYDVGRLTVFDGLHHVETPLLAEFIRAIEQAVWAKLGVTE